MKMWNQILLLAGFTSVCFGASLNPCPEGSICHSANEKLETTSFEFLNKYNQKDFRSIGSLIITNASLNKVDPKVKYLKNLAYLDLSYNNIQISSLPPLNSLKTLKLKANNLKNINISLLPQNVENLDLSDNLLSQISREWRLLKNLKTLDLYKNPIDCDCTNVLNYDRLIKSGITIPRPLTCNSPNKYAGKDITAINCSIADIMLYDEPQEGSGFGENAFEDTATERKAEYSLFNEEDDQSVEKNTIIDDKDDNLIEAKPTDLLTTIEEEEGSGDEGSGYEVIPESGVLGCIENCSTPAPYSPGSSGSPLPSILDQARIIFEDLNILKEASTQSSTEGTSTAQPVKEPKVLMTNNNPVAKEVEVAPENVTKTGELEKASVNTGNTTAVYAVIGVAIFIGVLFLIAYFKKRNSKRSPKNRRELPALGEEMKPLSKPPITAVNDKPVKNSGLPERVPLINGQNGKPKDDAPKLNSFTPLPHPELPKQEDEVPVQNGSSMPEVEYRSKTQPELLTPQRERVTIKESEIPDSIPRTPLLVHRQKNSEGEIVTTLCP